MHVFQTPGVPPRMGSTILPIMGWTENNKSAARNIVAPNNQADPEILMRSLHQKRNPRIRRHDWLSARRTRRIFYNIRKGPERERGRESSPPVARASREGLSLSLHRRIGSRLRFREYLRSYREKIGRKPPGQGGLGEASGPT